MSGAALFGLQPGQDVAPGLPPVDLPSIPGQARPRVEITRQQQAPPPLSGPWEAYATQPQPAPAVPPAGIMEGPWTAYQGGPPAAAPAPPEAPQPPGNFEPVQHAENYSRVGREGVAPEVPSVGIMEALGRGALHGATAGFGDEMAGLRAAGGGVLPETSPLSVAGNVILGGVRLGYEALTGNPGGGATQAYETARDEVRRGYDEAKSQKPSAVVMGNIAGAAALPVGNVARGAAMGTRMARGALTGGGVGAVAGAGEGENLTERASGAAVGGVTGAVTGAVLPPVSEAIVQAGRALARPVKSLVEGAIAPERVAARKIGEAISAGVRSDPNALARLTPQEWAQMVRSGAPAMIMELGGEPARALARAAANLSREARNALNHAINQRFESQGQRLVNWLDQRFGFPNASARQEAIEQTARSTNNAAYRRAYRDGAEGLWSPELERLAGSDAVTAAMQRAVKAAKDEAIVGGHGAMNPRITFTPDGRIQFNQGRGGVPTYPDLQFWDLTRRELSDAAIRAGRGTAEARRLESFARTMNSELDRLVPSYQQARQGAAGFFGAENALEAGQNFVMGRFANNEAARAMSRMSPAERQLFQEGFASRLVETINRTGDRRNIWNQITGNPEARQKLNIALGPQGAREIEAMSRVEGIMDLGRQALQGNSTTTRQLVELGLVSGSGSYAWYSSDPYALTVAALTGGRRLVDRQVARHVAEMLTSQNPQIVQRGIALVARNERLLNALRSTDSRLIAAGSEQAPTRSLASGAQGMLPGRADENRPEAPGPRRQ